MRSTFLTSAALLFALGGAGPVVADVLSMPNTAGLTPLPDDPVPLEDVLIIEEEGSSPPVQADEDTEPAAKEETQIVEQPAVEEKTPTEESGKFGKLLTPSKMVDMPQRGLSMDQVEQRFGKPDRVEPPVGDPPITHWSYPEFSVYFEYRYVIDSVVK